MLNLLNVMINMNFIRLYIMWVAGVFWECVIIMVEYNLTWCTMNELNRVGKLDKFVSMTFGNRSLSQSTLWTVKLPYHLDQFIDIKMFGQSYLALIDTGANISCMTVGLYYIIQNLPISGSEYQNIMIANRWSGSNWKSDYGSSNFG